MASGCLVLYTVPTIPSDEGKFTIRVADNCFVDVPIDRLGANETEDGFPTVGHLVEAALTIASELGVDNIALDRANEYSLQLADEVGRLSSSTIFEAGVKDRIRKVALRFPSSITPPSGGLCGLTGLPMAPKYASDWLCVKVWNPSSNGIARGDAASVKVGSNQVSLLFECGNRTKSFEVQHAIVNEGQGAREWQNVPPKNISWESGEYYRLTVNGLKPETTYSFRVRAVTADLLKSQWSKANKTVITALETGYEFGEGAGVDHTMPKTPKRQRTKESKGKAPAAAPSTPTAASKRPSAASSSDEPTECFMDKVKRLKVMFDLDDSLPLPQALKKANESMGLPDEGTFPDQVEALLRILFGK